MTKISLQQTRDFFEGKEIAIAGVSRNPRKFGSQVYKFFKDNQYRVYPLNPAADSIDGDLCYKSVAELPASVESLVVLTKPVSTDQMVSDAIAKGIKNIWIQQMSQTPTAIEKAQQAGINLVYGKCIFMFAEPVGSMHKFHRGMMKLFGRYPK